MSYTINYHTGAGNFEVEGDLDDAKTQADDGATYTQQPITIEQDGNVIARRSWWGVEPEEDGDIIRFGSYGYYGEWEEDAPF